MTKIKGTVFPRPGKRISGQRGLAPLAPFEEWTDPDTGRTVRAGRNGSSWSWQFTTGSKVKGTPRRHHSRSGYSTEAEAREAMVDALRKVEEQEANGPKQRLATLAVAVEMSLGSIVDLVDSGLCTLSCLFAMVEEEACICRCEGAHHGLARGEADDNVCHSLADPIAQLRTLRSIRSAMPEHEADLIRDARKLGYEWEHIGEAAGRNPEYLSRKYGVKRPGGVHQVCPNGHPYDAANTMVGGRRRCLTCATARAQRQRRRRR